MVLIHEPGDEAFRPTNKPWKCPKCGIELYLVETIEGHKERCKGEREKKDVLRPRGTWKSPVTGKVYEMR